MASQDTLFAKLEQLDTRFEEVSAQMNDPEVASNQVLFITLAKEHSQLSKIVNPFRQYKDLLDQKLQAAELLAEAGADDEMKAMAKEEIDTLATQAEEMMEQIKGLLVMGDDQEICSVVMEIRAGTGGDEAALFVGDLLNMYRHYAETRRWKVEILSASPTELGGFREVFLNIKGEETWSHLGYEGGGHRVQRVPKTETQGRIHTSAATVAVLPEPENIDIQIDWDKDVLEHVSRAGGPGGQSVNKIESAIKLDHIPTGITVSMRDEKSQHKNRAKARRILAARVWEHHRSAQLAEEAAARKAMIGSGDRSQRVRTYNFPQNRCTDHRLKGTGAGDANFNLERIIAGDLDGLIESLIAHDKAERLANL